METVRRALTVEVSKDFNLLTGYLITAPQATSTICHLH